MKLAAALVSMALAVAAPCQQLVLAQNDNLSYGNYAVGWPSSVIAFRFTAPSSINLQAAQVFTGNQTPATHSLEIRTRNATTGLPDQLLGQPGSWQSIHARCWQGASFAQAVALTGGVDYFLVWRVQGMFPQHSVCADTNPGNVLGEVRYSDGNSWHAQANAAGKFRLFAPYATGTTATFGSAKNGIYGAPTIGCSGWPSIGNPIDVWLDNAARLQTAALLVGWPVPAGIPFPFGTVWVTGDVITFHQTRPHSSPTAGATSSSFFVPNQPVAIGLPLSFQWFVLDAAAADGIAHSPAVTATLQ